PPTTTSPLSLHDALPIWLLMKTGALPANFSDALAGLGSEAAQGHFTLIFAKGIIGGWLIALVAWMVTASHWTIGQVAITWMLTLDRKSTRLNSSHVAISY